MAKRRSIRGRLFAATGRIKASRGRWAAQRWFFRWRLCDIEKANETFSGDSDAHRDSHSGCPWLPLDGQGSASSLPLALEILPRWLGHAKSLHWDEQVDQVQAGRGALNQIRSDQQKEGIRQANAQASAYAGKDAILSETERSEWTIGRSNSQGEWSA